MDFDEASAAWRENKVYKGKGVFAYKCIYIHSNGKHCSRSVYAQIPKYETHPQWSRQRQTSDTYCKQHLVHGKLRDFFVSDWISVYDKSKKIES